MKFYFARVKTSTDTDFVAAQEKSDVVSVAMYNQGDIEEFDSNFYHLKDWCEEMGFKYEEAEKEISEAELFSS